MTSNLNNVTFDNISKDFYGVPALKNINLKLQAGKVNALLGENGAGKSTLLKILSGYHSASTGELIINEQSHIFKNPQESFDAGIAVIYQELNLVNELSVAENIFLGHYPTKWSLFINRKELNQATNTVLQRILKNIKPNDIVKYLSIAEQQMIEIAKALVRNANIIAFDEPTSSLSYKEVKKLFEIINMLKKSGKTIIYVSHRIEEIFQICDTVSVLKDGEHVVTYNDISEVNEKLLVEKMVGRKLGDNYYYKQRDLGQICFEGKNLIGETFKNVEHNISFKLRKKEILGVFGLVGAGRTEIMKAIFGSARLKSGTIIINNKKIKIISPLESIKKGLTYATEDRKKEGIIPIQSVKENLNITFRRFKGKLGFINFGWEKENYNRMSKMLNIKTASSELSISSLSGGNQQKVVLARLLSEDSDILILDEPTRGIDVGAKREIYEIIDAIARRGSGVIVISSDLPEIIGISDRIIVMQEGKIVGELDKKNDDITENKILTLALPTSHDS